MEDGMVGLVVWRGRFLFPLPPFCGLWMDGGREEAALCLAVGLGHAVLSSLSLPSLMVTVFALCLLSPSVSSSLSLSPYIFTCIFDIILYQPFFCPSYAHVGLPPQILTFSLPLPLTSPLTLTASSSPSHSYNSELDWRLE